ncbi:MAG: hypothetical protein M3Z17_10950 [Gemmatimonadota bacterium]|nr:hypothetical protein [Gemmatimonadota bacterium]
MHESTPRRNFVKSVAAGAALLATRAATGRAESAIDLSSKPASDAWLRRIHGKHRQVIDATMPNGGFAPVFALNFIDSYKAQGVPESELTSVISYRHFAMPLMLNDSIWARYKIGNVIGVTDPKTNAPAMRNVFRDSILLHPGLTYEQITSGQASKATIIMTACDVALHALSGMTAGNAGVSAETAANEWRAALLPGVVMVPSGVYAISRAQEMGCTYCFGG